MDREDVHEERMFQVHQEF